MKRRVILIIASVALVVGLLLAGFGCAPAPAGVKTLKIGIIEALNWPIGTDAVDAIQVDVDRINEDGGLLIGGERYKLEIIVDDNKMDLALAKTAAEKQIYQDKVDFIKGDMWCMSYLDLVDENGVVTVASPITFEIFDPKYHYCFHGGTTMTAWPGIIHWVANYRPDLKTIVFAFPDNLSGHAFAVVWELAAETAGMTVLESIFYPYPTTDVSAVATRIKALNPDCICPHGGGPDHDSMIIKAVYVAGWEGQVFDNATIPGGYFLEIAGPAASEGLLAAAWPAEFEPALTEMSREFKADFIAKYGEWRDPEVVDVLQWYVLTAALQKASSPDPDEVAEIIGSGLEFECAMGKARMVSRPDYDNPRTVQIILSLPMKQVVGGKIEHIGDISLDDMYSYASAMYGW